MLLLSRPRPNKQESLRGYILRLSQANHYHTTQYVLETADLWGGANYDASSRYVFGNDSLRALAKITNTSVEQLESLRYGLDDHNHSTLLSHTINSDYIRLDYPRICPACIEEKGLALALWDISNVTVCPTHHIALFDHCPECNTRLRWNRPAVHQCHQCDCDFRKYTADRLLLNDYRLSRYIYQLCTKQPASKRNIPRLLHNYSVQHVIELSSALAQFNFQLETAEAQGTQPLSFKAATNEVLHSHYTKGFQYLDNWPNNFYHFLDTTRSKRRIQGACDGISKEIGSPFYFLKSRSKQAIYQPLWEAYHHYRNKRVQETRSKIESEKKQAGYISLKAAAQVLNIRPEQIPKLCRRLKLKLKKTKGGRYQINRSDIDQLKAILQNLQSLSAVSKELGITTYLVKSLIDAEIIIPFRGPNIDGSRGWLIEQTVLDQLKQHLLKNIRSTAPKNQKLLSFKQALSHARFYKQGLPELVNAILKGKLHPVHRDKIISLSNMTFPEHEVLALRPATQNNTDYWQPPEIQQYLGCKRHIVFGLINTGQLPSEKIELPGRTRPVLACKKTDVITFKKKYLLLPLLAERLKLTPKPLEKLLYQEHINPVSGLSIDGGYCCLYLRRLIRKSILKKIFSSLTSKKIDQALKSL